MKGRERWRQGKAKRSRGGAKSGRRRRRKIVYRTCAVDLSMNWEQLEQSAWQENKKIKKYFAKLFIYCISLTN